MYGLLDARALHLISPRTVGICYANCPRWHGCDCPPYYYL